MKSRVNELISRSTAAMISAIEIYNKPNFLYRGETFAILAINSWELIIKAKWLSVNNNNINSLYVYENKNNKDGKKSRRRTIKLTKSNNPFTHSIGKIANLLINSKLLDNAVWANLEILIEIRDSAIHFYNFNERLTITLQEVAAASIRNYLMVLDDWFRKDLSKYNFYLMPLSFISPNQNINSLVLNTEEKNLVPMS